MKLLISYIGIILFLCTSPVTPTTVNGKFSVTESNNLQFTVLLQLNTNTGSDDLGGTTIVLGFDTNAVSFPDMPVKGVNYIFQGFDSGQYSAATVTKPLKNQIWVNIDLPFVNSNNGTIIASSPEWTDVVRLNFDVVNPIIEPSLSWHLSSLFWGVYDADNTTLWEIGTFEGNFGLVVQVNDGWNLVSVPGINPDGQGVDNWWPGKKLGTEVYRINNGLYESVLTTSPGEGYWMNHDGANIYNTGDEWPAEGIQPITHYPIDVLAGWNLIGGFEKVVQLNQITTTPPGLIRGPIYSFSQTYQIANAINPGYGYLVYLTGSGQINFSSDIVINRDGDTEYFDNDWGKLTFTDNLKRSFSLFVTSEEVDWDLYELPPSPPNNVFDIRFESGKVVENIDGKIKSIVLSGINFPLKLVVENLNITLEDELGKIVNQELSSGDEITIYDKSISKLLVQSRKLDLPDAYILSQNYPNPFNPTTKIEFTLPFNSNVDLSIYNILGELVTTLVNENLMADRYEYEFNSSNLASGIYIYRITAGNFVSSKKMILMK